MGGIICKMHCTVIVIIELLRYAFMVDAMSFRSCHFAALSLSLLSDSKKKVEHLNENTNAWDPNIVYQMPTTIIIICAFCTGEMVPIMLLSCFVLFGFQFIWSFKTVFLCLNSHWEREIKRVMNRLPAYEI